MFLFFVVGNGCAACSGDFCRQVLYGYFSDGTLCKRGDRSLPAIGGSRLEGRDNKPLTSASSITARAAGVVKWTVPREDESS